MWIRKLETQSATDKTLNAKKKERVRTTSLVALFTFVIGLLVRIIALR